MKTIAIRELQKDLKRYVDASQTEQVVITRHGKPAAICIGVEGHDWETLVRATDIAFWQLIAERRQEPTITHEELKARLGGDR
jgi:prevent-host-death family protein